MSFIGQHLWHLAKRTTVVGLVFGSVLINVQLGLAQSWPINNPEVREPVPQYSPRYPLTSPKQAHTDPQSNAPTPVVEADEALQQDPSVTNGTSFSTSRSAVDRHELPDPASRHVAPGQPTGTAKAIESNTRASKHASNNWNPYRNGNAFPIDPRKPCNRCARPVATQPLFACNLPGLKGRPYIDVEPGACQCNKKKPFKHPEYSVFWPRPFSAKLDGCFPNAAAKRNGPCQQKCVVDVFDRLADFKLINYHRTDNGYCGRGADPYGCLGENKQAIRLMELSPAVGH